MRSRFVVGDRLANEVVPGFFRRSRTGAGRSSSGLHVVTGNHEGAADPGLRRGPIGGGTAAPVRDGQIPGVIPAATGARTHLVVIIVVRLVSADRDSAIRSGGSSW